MLEFDTGVPGSGKSYKGVNHLYNSFIDEKSKDYGKYERFYTNINEFHFSYFNHKELQVSGESSKPTLLGVLSLLKQDKKNTMQSPKESIGSTSESALGSDEIAFPLYMDKLILSLTELYDLYVAKQPDSILLERAKELKLSNSLFVIDEAHNYFDSKNDVLIWWLSYHRHLHQDIVLITQNLTLIYRKYLSFGEFFYKAVPSALRLRGSVFVYHEFISYKMYKKDHTNTLKISFNPEVFKLYGSGANTQSKKVVYKFIAMALIFAVVVFFIFVFISHRMSHGSDNNVSSSVSSSNSLVSSQVFIDRSKSFTVVCVGFECSFMGQNISLNDLNRYSKEYQLQPIKTSAIGEGVFLRTFASNDKFLSEVLNVQIDSSSDR